MMMVVVTDHVVVMVVMDHVVVMVVVDRRSGQGRRGGKTDNHRRGNQQMLNHSVSS
jgi:hypothetical protein